jgi:pyruvate formate-lyase/glycerol dehydratase family glycyl radical enzyme
LHNSGDYFITDMESSTERIQSLRKKTLDAERFLSVEQAGIITSAYRKNEGLPVMKRRALALAQSLTEISISIDPEEMIAGNRTPGIRAGVVFPEAGISWLQKEIDTLQTRPQDPFKVREEDSKFFFDVIVPYWKGKTLEDDIHGRYGNEIKKLETVVRINQKDHAQGHICPDVAAWLHHGPAGLITLIEERSKTAGVKELLFYECAAITLAAAIRFIKRYADLATEMAEGQENEDLRKNLLDISAVCLSVSKNPPSNFREAVQSAWFLFVILQMESNASSFSPGRMDQYLYPFFEKDRNSGIPVEVLQEITDAIFIKFNHIVYMRNSHSAKYFAGFPTGFNITVGGRDGAGKDATNDLSFVFLKAQDHVRLPQPNLSARLHHNSPQSFLDECSRVIGLGTGMPQIVNDESIIPALEYAGFEERDAADYALVGCVEISPPDYLGWSDAAMFNMVKVLELTLNDGKCMLTGEQLGARTGTLVAYNEYQMLEKAFSVQLDHFTEKMILACEVVERCHREHLPSPFLSVVVADCVEKGIDVTAGGAKYNSSGIQAIQAANIADSLAALKTLVYDEKLIDSVTMLSALKDNFSNREILRQRCINKVPKYGNDEQWVDEIGAKWVKYFAESLRKYTNLRGGPYLMGLYTVSAHVPMGRNVAATPDGRLSGTPLADGGLSPMYGRDKKGPTAVLNSVSRIPSHLAPNGTLLNMKFLPQAFSDDTRTKFTALLRSFVSLPVHHVQFNVVTADELKKAKADPGSYRGLTIRVAGYTAFFTELGSDLQDEIISRTSHGE